MKNSKPLLNAFDDLLGPPVESDIPEGFYSINQIAERHHLAIATVAARLAAKEKIGKCERRRFRSETGRVCWYYRVT